MAVNAVAAPNVLKVILFFNLNGDGWSETYYVQGGDPVTWLYGTPAPTKPGLTQLGPDATVILAGRAAMLSNNAGVQHIRVSLDGVPHQAAGASLGLPGYQGTYPPPTGLEPTNLTPQTRVLCRAYSVAGAVRYTANHYFGGLPGVVQDAKGNFLPDAQWMKALKTFTGALIASNAFLKSRPQASAASAITGFAVNADAQTANVAPNVLGNVDGTIGSAIIRTLKAPHGWNGVHRAVVKPDPLNPGGHIMVIGPTRKPQVTVPPYGPESFGTVAALIPVYTTLLTLQPQGLVKKSTGRPFGVPVGRRTRP